MTCYGSTTFKTGYTPFGEEYEATGSSPIDYIGQACDSVTGLCLMGSRFYSPLLGRLLQRDTDPGNTLLPLSMNAYVYSGDNPTTYSDPTGHSWWSGVWDFMDSIERVDLFVMMTALTAAEMATCDGVVASEQIADDVGGCIRQACGAASVAGFGAGLIAIGLYYIFLDGAAVTIGGLILLGFAAVGGRIRDRIHRGKWLEFDSSGSPTCFFEGITFFLRPLDPLGPPEFHHLRGLPVTHAAHSLYLPNGFSMLRGGESKSMNQHEVQKGRSTPLFTFSCLPTVIAPLLGAALFVPVGVVYALDLLYSFTLWNLWGFSICLVLDLALVYTVKSW